MFVSTSPLHSTPLHSLSDATADQQSATRELRRILIGIGIGIGIGVYLCVVARSVRAIHQQLGTRAPRCRRVSCARGKSTQRALQRAMACVV
jgi:hypothetical protein